MKKTCRFIGIFMLFVTFILNSSGCMKKSEPEEIVIGVAWPFEANNSQFNEGIDMAVKEINESGGINGKELKLLKMDDNSEVTKGIAVSESLSEHESVRAVIGHRSSYVSIPASEIYEEAGLVMLSPASTAPELIRKEHQNIFRIIPSDDVIACKVAEYLAGQNIKRMVIYYSEDSYGEGLANSFEDQAKSHGITIVDRISYYSDAEELKRLHSRWEAFGFDGIFIATSMSGGGRFLRDAEQCGINVPFAAGNTLDSPELSSIGEAAAEGIVIGSVFDPYEGSQQVESFVDNFMKLYGQAPGNYAALGYDAVKILAAAIDNTDKSDRESVAEGLRSLGSFTGVCGVHEFSDIGEDLGDLVVLKQLQEGTFVCLEK